MEFKKNTQYDVVGMGEVMLRLSTPDKETISQSEVFIKNAGGSELNVVSGSAMLGLNNSFITKLPDSKIGNFIKNKIRFGHVCDNFIITDTSKCSRVGIYYYESGAYPRKSSVQYDRENTSINSLSVSEINPDIFSESKIFHISSITTALSKNLRKTIIDTIKEFKENGAKISFDVNYRSALWSEDEAREVIESILPMVDLLFVSEETSRRMFKKKGNIEYIMAEFQEEYGCELIATTRREVISPTRHNFTSIIYYNGEYYSENQYENIEVVDRIGSGDAYVAGVLFGLVKFNDCHRALQTGNALSSAKNTVVGDMALFSYKEIENIISSHSDESNNTEMER